MMLDTYGRKWVDPMIDRTAKAFKKRRWQPNQVTALAFVIGLGAGLFTGLQWSVLAVICLWFSGFLDAVDGALARQLKATSGWGTVLDITFDRLVEIGVILGIAYRQPENTLVLLLLTSSIIISMTIFLTVGALSQKQSKKSFYYQAGIMERTEGFILLTAMILWQAASFYLTLVFAGLVLVTAAQRLKEAHAILK